MTDEKKNLPIHIREPDRARPPGKAGEPIISKFVDISSELSSVIGSNCSATVAEPADSFRVCIDLNTDGASAEVENGLIHVHRLPNAEGGGDLVSRAFTVPDDLERSLIDVNVDGRSLVITLPRTAETTRIVRQLERAGGTST